MYTSFGINKEKMYRRILSDSLFMSLEPRSLKINKIKLMYYWNPNSPVFIWIQRSWDLNIMWFFKLSSLKNTHAHALVFLKLWIIIPNRGFEKWSLLSFSYFVYLCCIWWYMEFNTSEPAILIISFSKIIFS